MPTPFKFKRKYTKVNNVSFTGSSLVKTKKYLEGIESVLSEIDQYYNQALSILNQLRLTGKISSSQLTLLGCVLADVGIDIMSDLIIPIMNQREPIYRYKNQGGWLPDSILFTATTREDEQTGEIVTPQKQNKLEGKSTADLLRLISKITAELARRSENE